MCSQKLEEKQTGVEILRKLENLEENLAEILQKIENLEENQAEIFQKIEKLEEKQAGALKEMEKKYDSLTADSDVGIRKKKDRFAIDFSSLQFLLIAGAMLNIAVYVGLLTLLVAVLYRPLILKAMGM